MRDILRSLRGLPVELLPFDQVKERLHLQQLVDRGVQEVPLDRIVGTVGREGQFNRAFMPKEESLRDRWEDVKDLAEGSAGFSSVELYYVNDVYFVVDGHHRVSVARTLHAGTIEARVKEFATPLRLDSNTSLEDLILRSAQLDFLDTTGLIAETPDEYKVTAPNGYERLLEHISGHRWYLGLESQREPSWSEAVLSWRDRVYLPMVREIRRTEILKDFPDSTETDLYLFVMDHLHFLREQYGAGAVAPEEAIREFAKGVAKKKKKKR
jgi:hypothetical protein